MKLQVEKSHEKVIEKGLLGGNKGSHLLYSAVCIIVIPEQLRAQISQYVGVNPQITYRIGEQHFWDRSAAIKYLIDTGAASNDHTAYQELPGIFLEDLIRGCRISEKNCVGNLMDALEQLEAGLQSLSNKTSNRYSWQGGYEKNIT